jgi:hypothetical protein
MGANVVVHAKDSTKALQNDTGKPQTTDIYATDNALHTHNYLAASAYGAPAHTLTDPQEFTAGAADNAVLYTSTDISFFNYHIIENFATSTAAIDVYVSLDGTNFNATAVGVQLADDVSAGGTNVITIPIGKIGILHKPAGKVVKIQCLQDGAGAADGRILHGNL